MGELASLSISDYVAFSLVIGISFLIGILSTTKSKNSTNDFLTANRSMHFIPVGFSLLTSYISSISLLGYSGEAYANGIQLYAFTIGGVLGILSTSVLSLPVFSPLHLTSMNEYLLLRFKSNALKRFVSLMYIAKSMLYMGICLYAPTIALSAVTSLDIYTYIYILGVLCTIYSSVGGIRAVIWTDVFQLIVMSLGLIVVVILGCYEVGGVSKTWSIASSNNRTSLLELSFDPTVRHSLWNTFVQGFFQNSFTFGISQLNLQRISSVPTERDARKLLVVTSIGMLVLYGVLLFGGLVVYAAYIGCDPLTLGILKKKEETLPYFVLDRLGYMNGLPGVFIATLFSGTLSSLSTALNGCVAMVWKDFMEEIRWFKEASDFRKTMINRILCEIFVLNNLPKFITALSIGFATIGIALQCTKSKSLVDFNFTVMSVLGGPVYGVFLLGLLVPWSSVTGAWVGMLVSWAAIMWISVASTLYSPPPPHLPFSVEDCNSTDSFLAMSSSVTNWTGVIYEQDNYSPPNPSFHIYNLSYTLYFPLSTLISLIFGMVISYAIGKEDFENLRQDLISPVVRGFYWKKSPTPSEE